MGILRTLVGSNTGTTPIGIGTSVAVAAAAAPSGLPLLLLSSSRRNLSFFHITKSLQLQAQPAIRIIKSSSSSSSFLPMDDDSIDLPELVTEFMVDMKCDKCVDAVTDALQSIPGVTNVHVDLPNQLVRLRGTSPLQILTQALNHTGRKARLIGQGLPQDFMISAAVAEFKGPQIFGVVRLAQVSMELARIEANFSGLSPGKHAWSINQFGDLTKGAASTGNVYNPATTTNHQDQDTTSGVVLGDLGTLDVDEKGEAYFSGVKQMLRVSDLIGRSVVVYGTAEVKSDEGITAAVIARSAGVGENYKKLCTCDGTTIWESTDSDFVASKV